MTVMRQLITAGAVVNAVDTEGQTALLYCVRQYHNWAQHGHEQETSNRAVQLLLAAGADVDIAGNSGDRPLHIAIRAGFTDSQKSSGETETASCRSVLQQLLKAGVDVDAADAAGRTALHIAVSCDNCLGTKDRFGVVQALIAAGDMLQQRMQMEQHLCMQLCVRCSTATPW